MRYHARIVDCLNASAFLALAAAIFGLAGCQVGSLNGPNRVSFGGTYTYTMEYSASSGVVVTSTDVTSIIVAQVPSGWRADSSSYTGTVNGVPVSGSGTVVASDPSGCTLPPIPAGYQRIVFTAGPFAVVPPSDSGTAALTFRVGGAPGTYTLSFWGEASNSFPGPGCQILPAEFDVSVTAPSVPVASSWGLAVLVAAVLVAGILRVRSPRAQ